jgi:FKBP-type peptidyl-prolyl cis-trans isomerase FkpA
MYFRSPFLVRATALSFLLGLATACSDSTDPGTPSNPATDTYAQSLGVNLSQMTRISDALYIQDLVPGGGTLATTGKAVQVTYTGWLPNGTQFESNVGKATYGFTLGAHEVIEGWDLGLIGMKVGGKRRLVIGSALGYGSRGNGPIPPNSTLVFDVQLVSAQ